MAKKSVDNRNKKRIKMVANNFEKRKQLKLDSINPELSDDERWEAMIKLQKMPRDTSPVRVRNRCKRDCSRPRSYDRRTGMCRIHTREHVVKGDIPGVRKASW